MFKGRKIVVVMPAYNAELTIERTHREVLDEGIVDHVVVVDDHSRDDTVARAENLLETTVFVHRANTGYGGNQKSCYRIALEHGADIVVMVHPDYQYTPKLLTAMVSMIASDLFDCVLASRILGGGARSGGMPAWKYAANRILTALQNLLMGAKLSEYHTGYRAFSRQLIESLDLEHNSDDFVFDNEMLTQILWRNFRIGEVSCPTRYFPEASSISFRRSVRYGAGCLQNALRFRAARWGLARPALLCGNK